MRKILFFLLIFFLPTQIGLHFWPYFSRVAGFKVDYLSPTLYLFDLLLVLNLFISKNKNFLKLPKTLYLACLLNLIYVKFSPIVVYGWLRIFEYSFFLKYLLSVPNLLKKILLPCCLVTFLICLLTILQFLTQHSLQGPFYLLGERLFDPATPNFGVLNFDLFTLNFRLLRPPSLFPHPNALAGYLLLIILLSEKLRFSSLFKKLLVLSLLLTFSKTAIFTYVLIFILRTSLIQNLFISLLLSISPFYLLLYPLSFPPLDTRYHILNTLSSFSFSDYLFGIGPKTFISKLPDIYPMSNINSSTLQPLHNLPLLILLELGLLPLLLIIKNIKYQMYNLFSIILLTGSLDHYWWTLPQNTLSFILVFVLLFRYGIQRNNNSH